MDNKITLSEELTVISDDINRVLELHKVTPLDLFRDSVSDDIQYFIEYQKECDKDDPFYDETVDETLADKIYANTMQENAKRLFELGTEYYDGTSVIKQNKKSAIASFAMSASKGHILAMINTALMFYNGEGTEKNYIEAFYWFVMAAANENERAYYYIADFYMRGLGVVKINHYIAADFYKKSAELGSPAGMYNYAALLVNGDGVKQDVTLAQELMRKAAKMGYKPAIEIVDECDGDVSKTLKSVDELKELFKNMEDEELYHHIVDSISYDVTQNYYMLYAAFDVKCDMIKKGTSETLNKLFDLYQKAKQAFYLTERWNLKSEEFDGRRYLLDDEYFGDFFLKYVEVWEKAVADSGEILTYIAKLDEEKRRAVMSGEIRLENKQIADEAFVIANILIENKFSKPLSIYAADYYRIAAILSKPAAQYELGLCYRWGTGGVYIDIDMAMYWFKRAMDNGSEGAKSIVEQYDSENGRNILRMSAISGIDGFGTKWYLDRELVEEYYRKADAGDMEAQYELARQLVPGDEFGAFKRDVYSAIHYYELAANQGCIDAAFNLANLYETGGLRLASDINKAFEWRKKCADLGDTEACAMVAKMYFEGRGTQKDIEKGKWYEKQAKQAKLHVE